MTTTDNDKDNQKYWRSLESLADSPEQIARIQNEFPQGREELELLGPVGRRKFLGLMGASMALAGMTSSCVRKPKELILPYTTRPEDLIEGKPLFFATSAFIGGGVQGLLVKSMDGRPIKIEGNHLHPMSGGSTSSWAQAEILNLYDQDRSREPKKEGKKSTLEHFRKDLAEQAQAWKSNGGKGLALLVEPISSPTLKATIETFKSTYPNAKVYIDAPFHSWNVANALSASGLSQLKPVYYPERADVIFAVDSDFLYTEGDSVVNAHLFARGRKVDSPENRVNRLYVAEPTFTVTGTNADHHIRIPASKIGNFLKLVARELNRLGTKVSVELGTVNESTDAQLTKYVSALTSDLRKNIGNSLIVVGDRQPAWVHTLGYAINAALGNIGDSINFVSNEFSVQGESLAELATSLASGQVDSLLVLGANPVYSAPSDVDFAEVVKKAKFSVAVSSHFDETAQNALWHVPASHFLESWGDFAATDGTLSIQQPLIAPMFESLSFIEVLVHATGSENVDAHETVKSVWQKIVGGLDFEKRWRKVIHDGTLAGSHKRGLPAAKPSFTSLPKEANAHDDSGLEVNFMLDASVYDGRYANNGWLQELPCTVTKITWDNAARVSFKTAADLKIKSGDMIEVKVNDRTLKIVAFVTPGTADNVICIPLGYGRDVGKISQGAGFNANVIRVASQMWIATGAQVSKMGTVYSLATTQEHGSLEGRNIIRENTLEGYKKDPGWVEKMEIMPTPKQKTLLWERPNKVDGQQWGLSIDLNSCIGCNACTIACQAENNISIVGKERVAMGREMHWIRIDRYFSGSVDDPLVLIQPMTCQQCENAPCESVCPVAATTHSSDGLNDMTYNRCIGTRYCANNCPYKVRRFNYFNFAKENHEDSPLMAMQKNPNVTVRFRGVMEKCTYCVQRISEARIETHKAGSDFIPDGRIITACAQVCPTNAITFGDINDPKSLVAQVKKQDRNYVVLGELNTQPRTSYLAKVRNPNPELV